MFSSWFSWPAFCSRLGILLTWDNFAKVGIHGLASFRVAQFPQKSSCCLFACLIWVSGFYLSAIVTCPLFCAKLGCIHHLADFQETEKLHQWTRLSFSTESIRKQGFERLVKAGFTNHGLAWRGRFAMFSSWFSWPAFCSRLGILLTWGNVAKVCIHGLASFRLAQFPKKTSVLNCELSILFLLFDLGFRPRRPSCMSLICLFATHLIRVQHIESKTISVRLLIQTHS